MKHFAAHFVFDGCAFIKNASLSFADDGKLLCVGGENSGLEEKERMVFLNGILCPYFDLKCMETNALSLREFLSSLGVNFDVSARLPVVLLENVDLQAMSFTKDTLAREIY